MLEQCTFLDPLNELMIKRGEVEEAEEFPLPLRDQVIIGQMFNDLYLNDPDLELVTPKLDRSLQRALHRMKDCSPEYKLKVLLSMGVDLDTILTLI